MAVPRNRWGGALIDGEHSGEHGASDRAVAGSKITSMRLHDALGNGEPQAHPSSLTIAGRLPPIEGREQVRQILHGQTRSRILDGEKNSTRVGVVSPTDLDTASGGRVAKGIVKHILDDAEERLGIPRQRAG